MKLLVSKKTLHSAKAQHHFYLLNRAILVLPLLLMCALPVSAQPSGGPYGPVHQYYELPDVEGDIYFVAPDGVESASGESVELPTTIEAAITRVSTGDAIILRGGLYRTGDLILNQGITMQPYQDEEPVLKGTYVADDWTPLRDGVWRTSWDRLFPDEPQPWWRVERETMRTPMHRFNNDMVFVDGRFLQSAGWAGEVDEDHYYINYEDEYIYIGVDPTDKKVEITAYNVAIHRTTDDVHGKSSDGRGFTIRGITFTQYAYRAFEIDGYNPEGISPEDEHGKDVVGITIEHSTISYCSRVAGYFRGDSLTIRNTLISDTSTEGIFILSSHDALLEKNIFRRNNIENITGYYPSAVKIFNQCNRVIVRDNLVIDHPNSNGIWYDVGNEDGVFINNWIEGVGHAQRDADAEELWPSRNGFFFEISSGAVVAGNVFVNNDRGLMVLNASDVHMYQNTFINSPPAIARSGRSADGDHFDWHPATGPDVDERDGNIFVNNLVTSTRDHNKPLYFSWQPADLCERLNEPMMERQDHNVYVRIPMEYNSPMMVWSPAENEACRITPQNLEEFRAEFPQFEENSRFYDRYSGPLFKSVELRNLQPMANFPGHEVATTIPEDVSKLLLDFRADTPYVGAWPPADQ